MNFAVPFQFFSYFLYLGVPREGGAPLGLGWNVVEHRVLPLNSFEEERTKRRVPK